MYRLIEIAKEGEKETQGIYPYTDFTAVQGEYETKVGANMKSNAYSASLVMVLDDELQPVIDTDGRLMTIKIGSEALKPRLIEVKKTTEEAADISKYDTTELVIANYHSKFGAAIKDTDVVKEVLRGIDGEGSPLIFTSWTRPIEPQPESTPEEPTE